MHQLLAKILRKRGIESLDELTPEEKANFDEWRAVLSKEELTIADIKEFCKAQCEIIKQKWTDYNLDQAKKAELLPYFTVYSVMLKAIDSPKTAREALEKQLENLIK